MKQDFHKGRYEVRWATTAADLHACQTLRHLCFFGGHGLDQDQFDSSWRHLMVRNGAGGPLVCTLRCRVSDGAKVVSGYAAAFYDLSAFAADDRQFMEIGRFCSDPAMLDPHILRVAWGAITQLVDASGVAIIFGCTSFEGMDPAAHAQTFQQLAQSHLGPITRRPGRKATRTVTLADVQAGAAPQTPVPPLLRTYLAMGGWVSDHAVIDHDMQTLHVLTALEIAAVPPARAKALRALV